jgi:acetyl esterase/lipase
MPQFRPEGGPPVPEVKEIRHMIHRRTLLLAGAAALVLPSIREATAAGEVLPLWPKGPPGGGGPKGPVETSSNGAISNISVPSMEVFRPAKPNGAAMLVAAGGGYKRIEMQSEAHPAAQWLNDHGVTAFVLSYRLPEEGWREGPRAPLQDAQRALRLIRARSAEYGIRPDHIGVLGFSAGGHLMGLAATRSAFRSYNGVDEADRQSARPNAAALIYPIITLEPPYDHTSTKRVLLGRHPTDVESAEWSVQPHVGAHCPPLFLVQAEDDPISDPHNTLIMEAAAKSAGVSAELHRLQSGGHGFGMGRPGTPTAGWPAWYEAWLRKGGFVA